MIFLLYILITVIFGFSILVYLFHHYDNIDEAIHDLDMTIMVFILVISALWPITGCITLAVLLFWLLSKAAWKLSRFFRKEETGAKE